MEKDLKYYKMRYRSPIVEEKKCSLRDAFEDAREDFDRGNSCCQIIIDEKDKIIYSLDEEEYLSGDFEYELTGEYLVLNSNYFDCNQDLDNLPILRKQFKGNE